MKQKLYIANTLKVFTVLLTTINFSYAGIYIDEIKQPNKLLENNIFSREKEVKNQDQNFSNTFKKKNNIIQNKKNENNLKISKTLKYLKRVKINKKDYEKLLNENKLEKNVIYEVEEVVKKPEKLKKEPKEIIRTLKNKKINVMNNEELLKQLEQQKKSLQIKDNKELSEKVENQKEGVVSPLKTDLNKYSENKPIIKLKPIEADFSEYGVKKEEQVKLITPEEYNKKHRKELLKTVKERKEEEMEKKKNYEKVIDDFFK